MRICEDYVSNAVIIFYPRNVYALFADFRLWKETSVAAGSPFTLFELCICLNVILTAVKWPYVCKHVFVRTHLEGGFCSLGE